MNHCSCDCDACSCSCIDGRATLRIVLSITTTIRQMHSTPRIHQRRDWTSSSLVPSLVSGARDRTLTLVAVPVTCARKLSGHPNGGGIPPGSSGTLEASVDPAVGPRGERTPHDRG